MAGNIAGAKVPGTGGLALGTFLALALGVALWPVLDSFIPAIGTALRGTGTRRVDAAAPPGGVSV